MLVPRSGLEGHVAGEHALAFEYCLPSVVLPDAL
jgi:hypothetical protein